jgi:hypothetical protein
MTQRTGATYFEPVVRTSITTNSTGESRLINSGLADLEGARAVARRLFDTYDRDRDTNIDNVEVVPMIIDVYKAFNRVFSPSRGDIESYIRILDRNGDGKVTLQDIEDLCVRYLCSNSQYTS